MRKLLIFGFIALLVFPAVILSACNRPSSEQVSSESVSIKKTMTESNGTMWQIRKSPMTGRCYEVLRYPYGYGGWAGMAEIPCEELK